MKKRSRIGKKLLSGAMIISLLLGNFSSTTILAEGFSAGETVVTEGEIFSDSLQEEKLPEENTGEIIEESVEEKDIEEEIGEHIGDGTEQQTSDVEEAELFGSEAAEEEEIRYIKGRPLTEEERQEQLEPMESLKDLGVAPVIRETGSAEKERQQAAAATYPAKYDTRKYGWITPVKNQDPYGLCWAFSLASTMETSLLKQGKGTYDLSEEHLAYFFANRVNDPLNHTKGDLNIHNVNNMEGVRDYHESGNAQLASIFLSTWSGMTLESEFPLKTNSSRTQYIYNKWPASAAYATSVYLDDAVFANYSENKMKELITSYGSVTAMYYADSWYLQPDTAAYCYGTTNGSVNHVVTIVGWDDNYSKKNFYAGSNVTENGAWIAKNSWGTGWGDQGYFYLSYQDPTISALTTATANTAPLYKNNYFYDGSSSSSSYMLAPGEAFANIYTASANGKQAEILGEIVTAAYSDKSNFKIQIYTGLTDPSDPTSGNPAYAAPFSYYQKQVGIATITVPEVVLLPGEKYSVVIENAGSKYIDYCVETNADYGWVKFQASISKNQGFIYYNGLWHDCMNETYTGFTPRIKAHTKNTSDVAKLTLSKSSLTMTAGETEKLSVSCTPALLANSGVKYISSNTEVAKVDKTGKITAVGAGEALITCVSNSYPLTLMADCQVVVLPAQPQNAKAVVYENGRLKLSWESVKGATGYIIYRGIAGGTLKRYLTVSKTQTSYIDAKNIKIGTKYTYKIVPYLLHEKVQKHGTETKEFSVVMTAATPSVTVKTSYAVQNILSWQDVDGADGYYIYRRIKGKGWSKIAVLKVDETLRGDTISYRDKAVEALVTYEYTAKPYTIVDGKNLYGGYKASNAIITSPARQAISTIKAQSNGLSLKWSPQKKCTGYVIYRKTGNGAYKKIATLSGGNKSYYLDKTAKKGVQYTYYVRAYVKESYGIVYSKYSTYKAKR